MSPESLSNSQLPSKVNISLKDVPLIQHISYIRCGSYTTEWIARAIGLHPVPSNKVLKGSIWMDLFRPILPRDMRKLFKFRGMDSVEMDLSHLNDKERIDWVRNEIATKKKPLALLVRTLVLHWIAVAGYDDEKRLFYIYDSRFGSTSTNPFQPIGNATIRYEDLARIWKGRFWLNYKAIIIAVDSHV